VGAHEKKNNEPSTKTFPYRTKPRKKKKKRLAYKALLEPGRKKKRRRLARRKMGKATSGRNEVAGGVVQTVSNAGGVRKKFRQNSEGMYEILNRLRSSKQSEKGT